MKIRTIDDLISILDSDFSWRIKEISSLFLHISNNKQKTKAKVLIRAAIPIYYAHWEGFTKNAANAYLEYISRKRELYKNLNNNFIAIAAQTRLHEISKTKTISPKIEFIDFILNSSNETFHLSSKDNINTDSNLNSYVLKNILDMLGITFDDYWKKKSFAIDAIMLKNRNEIVHGESTNVDFKTFYEIHSLTSEIITQIKTTIENAACLKSFRINSYG